jgi:hypothetical protein
VYATSVVAVPSFLPGYHAIHVCIFQLPSLQTDVASALDGFVAAARLTLAIGKPAEDPARIPAGRHPVIVTGSVFEARLAYLMSLFSEAPAPGSSCVLDAKSVRRALYSWVACPTGKDVLSAIVSGTPAPAAAVPVLPVRCSLIDLPDSFDALCSKFASALCASCSSRPVTPVLCLVCGTFLCGGAFCVCSNEYVYECMYVYVFC